MEKKKMNDKGFSLVELIIVIAIMAVLVGVLAPQYLKYVNNSRVSTDVTNADEIATVVNTLVANAELAGVTSGNATVIINKSTVVPTSITVGTSSDLDIIMYNLGSSVTPKYSPDAEYTVTYNTTTGVSLITYTVETNSYEAYPNPDDTDGMNTNLKN